MVEHELRLVLMETFLLLIYHNGNEAVVQECSDVCDFYEWGKDAQCQGRNLESVPQECLHAKTLQMQDNRLTKLAQGSFKNFTCLKYLYLERNNMTVEGGSFEGCSMLEKVHLNQNHFPILTQDILEGMPNVLYMFLDNASVHHIQPRAFRNLTQLKFLSLEENRLNIAPCDAFSSENSLETLYLSGNNISYLRDNCFSDFSGLTKLYLRKNPLVSPNPLAFRGLHSLTLLDLQYTNLIEVPTGIFQSAINIEKLYLSHNNITHLTNRDFMSLYKLTHLNLHHNKIIVIQEHSFEFLGALQTLDLSFNRISSIRENTFSHISNIREIKLQNNTLASTRNISFNTLPRVISLNLAHNPLHCNCVLAPFLAWSKASISVSGDLPSHSSHARCSFPPAFAGRWVHSIRHSDICPGETDIIFEHETQTVPHIEMEERIHFPSDGTPTWSLTKIIVIVAVVFTVSIVVTVLSILKCKKQLSGRKKRQDPETNIQITPNPFNPEIHRQVTSPSSPSPMHDDDPYYLSLDGESQCRSPVHLPLHHPMPPCFSLESNVASSKEFLKVSDSTQNDIVYSSVLPDENLQRNTEIDVINYTTVRPDDNDVKQMPRPTSMMDEEPIEEWVKKNCRFNSSSTGMADKSNSRPIRQLENAGSPYITTITPE